MFGSDRRWLAVILAAALALRLGWAVVQPTTAAGIDRLPDQREYLTLADRLLHGRRMELVDARLGRTVVAYRLPGYPAFVAACGASVRTVRVVQAGLDTLTVLGVYLLGRRWASGTAAVVAAALVAVDPIYVYFAGLVLTETAFAAALVWGMVALGRGRTPAAVLCLVAAVYLRPTAIVLGPALAVLANRPGRRAYQLGSGLAVAAAIGLALAPWAWRNHRLLGTAVWTTTNDGITFYDGFHDGADGASDQRFLDGLLQRFPDLRSMNEVDRSRALSQMAGGWALHHPWAVAVLSARKVARGWSPVPLSDSFGRLAYRLAGGGFAVPFDLLCVVGLCRGRVRGTAVLVAPAVALTAVQVVTVGSIRYRMPAEAPLAVVAGAGAVAVWEWVQRRRHAPAGQHTAPPV